VADGQTHLIGNLVLGSALTATTFIFARDYTLYVFVGAVLGLIVTPDLDIDHATETEHIMRMVPVIGVWFMAMYYPYALMFKHRGLSHNLFLGTIGRVAWTLVIVAVCALFFSGLMQLFGVITHPLDTLRYGVLLLLQPALLLAWWAQDIMHYTLDI